MFRIYSFFVEVGKFICDDINCEECLPYYYIDICEVSLEQLFVGDDYYVLSYNKMYFTVGIDNKVSNIQLGTKIEYIYTDIKLVYLKFKRISFDFTRDNAKI